MSHQQYYSMNKTIIFTDLDGTLMDAADYSVAAAQKAIAKMFELKIPIVPCTSKTHLEVIEIQKKLGFSNPFITENGSAIFFTAGYFKISQVHVNEFDGYNYLTLGRTYNDVLNFFNGWRKRYNLSITGIHEMPVEKVMELTDLNYYEAEIAKKRFFSEPFIINNKKILPKQAVEYILGNGFRLLLGNRFYHLIGNSDKGIAVRKLTEMYQKKWNSDKLITIGIGDSMNDLEMLKVVNKPALVKKPTGIHEKRVQIDNLFLTEGIGPSGWQEAVFKFVEQ